MRKKGFFIACSLTFEGTHAIVISHFTPLASHQEYANQPAFSGLVEITGEAGSTRRTGSGFLIRPGWVVTAAHVVTGFSGADLSVGRSNFSHGVRDVFIAPGWAGGPETGLGQGADLALLRLTEGGMTSATSLFRGSSLLGSEATVLGTGLTGTGILGANGAAMRLAGTNMIDRQLTLANGGLLVTDFDDGSRRRNALNADTIGRSVYDDGFVPGELSGGVLEQVPFTSDATATALEVTTAPGDSGGPLLVFNPAQSRWELAGVTSWGTNPTLSDGFSRTDSRHGDLAFFTDLRPHHDWIFSTIPEPASTTLLLIAASYFLGFRSRRQTTSG